MRKRILIVISCLILVISVIVVNRFQEISFRLLNSVNKQKSEQIKENLEECDEIGFTALLCNKVRVPFDDPGNTFYVPVNMENEQWEILRFSSGQPEYKILFNEIVTNKNKSDLIRNGEKVEILVYNDLNWSKYNIVFTGLPAVDLTTDKGFYHEDGVTGIATFYDTDFAKSGGIGLPYSGHVYGNESQLFPKKSFEINLKNDSEKNSDGIFGLRAGNDWILQSLYNDDTKIRDKLSMQIWETYGAGSVAEGGYYGSNMVYVELIVDNVYWGLYGFAEPIDAKQLDLAKEDYSYAGKNPGTLKFHYFEFYEERNPLAEVQGFILEEGPIDERADLWKPMADLSAVLAVSNEEFYKMDSKIIDEYNATNLWLLLQIITGHDHTSKNVYHVARYNDEYQYKYRFSFAPWNMNLTWGNVAVDDANLNFVIHKKETIDDRVYWEVGDRLIKTNYHGSRDYMCALYGILRSTVLADQEVQNMISTLDNEIRVSGAFKRDKERWPEGQHADSCEELMSYALRRLEYLDKALYDKAYYAYVPSE